MIRFSDLVNEATVDTAHYEIANDKSPKGNDVWIFALGFIPNGPKDIAKNIDKIFEFEGTWAAAKKAAAKAGTEAKVKVVYLIP